MQIDEQGMSQKEMEELIEKLGGRSVDFTEENCGNLRFYDSECTLIATLPKSGQLHIH